MHGFRHNWLHAALLGLSAAVSAVPRVVYAEDIAPYRLTDVEGNAIVRFDEDTQRIGFAGGDESTDRRSTLREEVNILTHGYVYHPNFLKLDLGGGPVFVQNRLDNSTGSNRSNDTLYNFTTRLAFLDQKPYPLTLYYDHLNPTVVLGLQDTLTLNTDKYGGNFMIHRPDSPIGFVADAYHLHNQGEGFNTAIDDNIRQASFRLYSSLSADNFTQLSYIIDRQDSLSGDIGSLQPSSTDTTTAGLDTRLVGGAARQLRFTANLTNTEQTSVVGNEEQITRSDWRFAPDLRWQHTPTVNSFYRYDYYRSRQTTTTLGDIDNVNHSAVMGVAANKDKGLSGSADVHGQKEDTTGLTLNTYGAGGSLNYRYPFSVGSAQLSYGVIYDQKDRQAPAAEIAQVDEPVYLPDTVSQVALVHDYVVVASVVVYNYNRSQLLVENVDYRLFALGTKTVIQRLTVPINDQDRTFKVDYNYLTGGSAKFTILDQTAQANVTLYRFYNVYVRYRNSDQTLVSGDPTIPLNSVRNTTYGARADVPTRMGLMWGGEVSFETDREDISPYDRSSYDAYVQFPLPFLSDLRLTGRRMQVDYFNSTQGVNLTGYIVQLNSRPWYRTTLSLLSSHDQDTGADLVRNTWVNTIVMEWRLREVTLRAEGGATRDELGTSSQDRNMIRILLRRDFR